MPLYKSQIVNNHTRILLWKIEESFDELEQGLTLTDNCRLRLSAMKSEPHRKAFVSVRHLVREFGYKPSDMYYDKANGKPYLKDKKHISISHSFNFSSIIISDSPCGIDIEKQRSKIKYVAHKFANSKEYNTSPSNLIESLTAIWCAKEAAYKLLSISGISFKKHLNAELDVVQRKVKLKYKGLNIAVDFEVKYFSFEDFICGYVWQDV